MGTVLPFDRMSPSAPKRSQPKVPPRRRGPRPAEDKVVSELGDRILQAVANVGSTQTAIERALVEEGLTSKGYLSKIIYGERGNRSISLALISKMARLCEVEFAWLATGEGPMTKLHPTPTPPSHTVVRKKEG